MILDIISYFYIPPFYSPVSKTQPNIRKINRKCPKWGTSPVFGKRILEISSIEDDLRSVFERNEHLSFLHSLGTTLRHCTCIHRDQMLCRLLLLLLPTADIWRGGGGGGGGGGSALALAPNCRHLATPPPPLQSLPVTLKPLTPLV